MDHIGWVLDAAATNGTRTGTLRSALASTADFSRKTEDWGLDPHIGTSVNGWFLQGDQTLRERKPAEGECCPGTWESLVHPIGKKKSRNPCPDQAGVRWGDGVPSDKVCLSRVFSRAALGMGARPELALARPAAASSSGAWSQCGGPALHLLVLLAERWQSMFSMNRLRRP